MGSNNGSETGQADGERRKPIDRRPAAEGVDAPDRQDRAARRWQRPGDSRARDERDRIANERERIGDERERIADEREGLADQREEVAHQRGDTANERLTSAERGLTSRRLARASPPSSGNDAA